MLEHSHIGNAAIKVLESKHEEYKDKLWASTSGKVLGDIQHGPKGTWDRGNDPEDGHTDWLPDAMAGILENTEVWCDFLSLSPPTPGGLFATRIKKALAVLSKKTQVSGKKIVVRFLFGNIIATPTNCTEVMKEFTEDLGTDSKLEIWVGAWRRDMCWNHAKIVAADGKHVHTGGHNLWDPAYLHKDPIHDTSIELEGPVAIQAHQFANAQWDYIKEQQSSMKGWIIDKMSDWLPLPVRTRVTVTEWPKGAEIFPPLFHKEDLPQQEVNASSNEVKILSLGRYGKIGGNNARSSDDAFIAMFDAAQSSIRLLLQDLGPVNVNKKIIYRTWPKNYMRAWGRAMFEREVGVEIVLSNVGAGEERGNYSNGWSCEEVAAEIIKAMSEEFPDASQAEIKEVVTKKLRVCFIKNTNGIEWETQNKIGLHSKFFIVDDVCTYIGSQNLYVFDLAEWGVAIDDKSKTEEIMKSLWNPMWECSFKNGSDVSPERVMEILGVDRNPNAKASDEDIARMEADINVDELKKSKFYYAGEKGASILAGLNCW